MEKKGYDHIDLWKCIFAVAVIMIHTQPYINCGDTFVWYFSALFTRMAVPFFMISSSFFLGRKIREKGIDVISDYRKRLLPKLLIWGCLGLLMNAMRWYLQSKSIGKTLLLVIQSAVFNPKGLMWFILALIISSFILEFMLRRHVPAAAMGGIAAVLFAFALLCNTYYFLVSDTALGKAIDVYLRTCITARNGLFLFVYMFIGYAISSESMKAIRRGALILMVAAGCGLLVAEASLLLHVEKADDASLFLSYLVLIPSFILLLTTIAAPVPHHRALRSLSGVMYYTHPVFALLFNVLLSSMMGAGVLKFVIVLAATVAVWAATKDSKNRFIRKMLY